MKLREVAAINAENEDKKEDTGVVVAIVFGREERLIIQNESSFSVRHIRGASKRTELECTGELSPPA